MQVDTRELVKSLKGVPADKRQGWEPVPDEFEQAAQELLKDDESVRSIGRREVGAIC